MPLGSRVLSSVQVGVHYFHSVALINQHSLHIISSNPECDYQSIVMGLDGSDLIFVQESQYR